MNISEQDLKEMSYNQVSITCNDDLIKRWWLIHDMDEKVSKSKSDLIDPENWILPSGDYEP